MIVALLPLGLGIFTQYFSYNIPAINPTPASSSPAQIPAVQVTLLLPQALQLVEQGRLDAALDKLNAIIQAEPKNPDAYALRGTIYAEKKLWDQAEKDFQTVLLLDDNNVHIKFNLAEIEFKQKKYETARPGFFVLRQDPDVGDLATYRVFLCDLFGGHEDVAAEELDAFNRVGSNPSYYFANVAWSLYHHKMEDARDWLKSAVDIYAPYKIKSYAACLFDLGYLPIPSLQH